MSLPQGFTLDGLGWQPDAVGFYLDDFAPNDIELVMVVPPITDGAFDFALARRLVVDFSVDRRTVDASFNFAHVRQIVGEM